MCIEKKKHIDFIKYIIIFYQFFFFFSSNRGGHRQRRLQRTSFGDGDIQTDQFPRPALYERQTLITTDLKN